MPSTEMIFPVNTAPAVETVAQAPVSTPPAVVQTEPPVVVSEIAAPTVPAEPVPVVQEQVVADQAPFETPAPPQSHGDTQLLEPGFNFGFADSAAADPEIDQPTEFMFGVATPELTTNAAALPTPEPPKKGLKSLFSMFGRKEKTAAAKHEATVPEAPAAPSVFLPTVDASSAPVELAFAPPAESTARAQEPAQSAAESTDEDDGFSQFLSNL